ncbi:MAG: HD domain-containing phosphohydrolase [Gemmatimonadota bacterium]
MSALLLSAARTQALYPPGHHRAQEAIRDCYVRLRTLLQDQRRFRIALVDEEFIVGSVQVPVRSPALQGFAESLRRAGIGRVAFHEGLLQWELEQFLRILATESAALEEEGGVQAILDREGVQHLKAGPLSVQETSEAEGDSLVRAWEIYSSGIKTVKKIRHAARARGRLEHLDEAKDLAHRLVGVAAEEAHPLLTLHALKVHDAYSFTHSVNVALLTLVLAKALEFDARALHEITLAALLHDIGKERVPLEILNKPGKLTAEEREVMERHGPDGTKMLASAAGVGDLAPIVAYEHQLAYEADHPDSGKWPLHVASQMICIADVYDALRSVRPYRGELPPDVAMQIMHDEVAAKFDADLFEGFARLVGFYPPGTCIRLTSGAVGVVRRSNPHDPRRPRILVVLGPDGASLSEPDELDLSRQNGSREIFGDAQEVVDGESVGIDPFDYL